MARARHFATPRETCTCRHRIRARHAADHWALRLASATAPVVSTITYHVHKLAASRVTQRGRLQAIRRNLRDHLGGARAERIECEFSEPANRKSERVPSVNVWPPVVRI